MLNGKIDKIEIKDDTGFYTIWENGIKTAHKVRVGVVWELRVTVTLSTSGESLWGAAVTVITKEGKKYGKGARQYTSASKEVAYDIQGDAMPDRAITFSRIKLWVTSNHTNSTPPEAQW